MPVRQQKPTIFLLGCCLAAVCGVGYLVINGGSQPETVNESLLELAHSQQVELPVNKAPTPDDPAIITALEKLGGRVFQDRFGRVTKVILHRCPVTNADLALVAGLTELQTINLRGASCVGPGITDAGLTHLANLEHLRVLELSVNPGITAQGMKSLSNLKRLEYLNLCNTHVTNDGLAHLQGLSRLKKLCLPCPVGPRSVLRWPRPGGGGCTQEGLPALWGLPIEELSGLFLYEDGFQYLRGLNHLRRFPVDFGQPHDTDLVYLKDFAELESLAVGLSEGWQNTSRLRWLAGMRSLQTLDISGKPADSETSDLSGLEVLANLPALERLRLGRITDAGMAHLPKLPGVRLLDLSVSQIHGEGLAHLREKFPNLEALALDPTTLTAEGLVHFPELPTVRTLHLDGTPFREGGLSYLCPEAEHDPSLKAHLGDETLAALKNVPGLQTLWVRGLPITDEGLGHLRHTPGLEELIVPGTKITDGGLVHVRSLERLGEFAIENTAISYDAAAAFHKVRPRCRITDNWCCGCMTFEPAQTTNLAP